MTKKIFYFLLLSIHCISANAQQFFEPSTPAQKWVKKTFRSLSKDQRVAQLMIVRAHSNLGPEHTAALSKLIKDYNVGGLCFFQGGPVRQAVLTNYYQSIAKTPLMICMDGEWGLGMRLDSVINFPRQLMMGAVNNAALIYEFGSAVGEQCKRMGIQVNYAPDIDINNNPLNPVINDRSFGEDKYKVALYGTAYMRGLQNKGVMATGKHFPGHGDVSVDSHYDLPMILKTKAQLDELELYPFKALIQAGLGSIMTAHLYIPAIDTTPNLAATLSPKTVTNLLKNELGFKGIVFTDGLEMKGVTKFFPAGEASVQALIAGNDMLCLPEDIAGSIAKVRAAIKNNRLSWDTINARVKKVLLAKYNLKLPTLTNIDTSNLVTDLNAHTNRIKTLISKNAITLLRKNNDAIFPLKPGKKIAYISIGAASENYITRKLKQDYQATIYQFGTKATMGSQLMDDANANNIPIDQADSAAALRLIQQMNPSQYDIVIVGMHNYSRRPANNFGLSQPAVFLLNALQNNNTITLFFGNPYAISNGSNAPNLLACYEDDDSTQSAVVDILTGISEPKGSLPVTVAPNLQYGDAVVYHPYFPLVTPETVGLDSIKLQKIDTIAQAAITQQAIPGCVILVASKGKLVYHKAFGFTNYNQQEPIHTNMIYDLASITKIAATTVSMMKLVEEGKIDLNKTLGHYLPTAMGTDKAALVLKDILLHQAGLIPFIPFYKELIDTATGNPLPNYFSAKQNAFFSIRVAENLFLRNDWSERIYQKILSSKLSPTGKYVYSDNDFILLGKIIETVSGKDLYSFAKENFYTPLEMHSTNFKPRDVFPLSHIIPTENEKYFRQQLIRGDVHDEGAALMGGVAGHAGLFSNAYDLAQLFQLLLNGGSLNGKQLLKKESIDLFTSYQTEASRRGLGFDKPEKDNATRLEAYPSKSASSRTYGHTGFTGTCVWVDPAKELIYIFLSNRVTPSRSNNKLSQLHIRSRIQEAIYDSIK